MAQPSLLPQERKVEAIKDGTVIDHIPSGVGSVLLRALDMLVTDKVVSIGLNFKSKRAGTKDLIKIEQYELDTHALSRVAIIAPGATVSTIRDFKVVDKIVPTMPEEILGLAECPNPQCITNHEKMTTHFVVRANGAVSDLRCHYCEKLFLLTDLEFGR